MFLKFTTQEDNFLREGITKHGFGQWAAILRDHDLKFQDGRTADSLKKRAGMKMTLSSVLRVRCLKWQVVCSLNRTQDCRNNNKVIYSKRAQ